MKKAGIQCFIELRNMCGVYAWKQFGKVSPE